MCQPEVYWLLKQCMLLFSSWQIWISKEMWHQCLKTRNIAIGLAEPVFFEWYLNHKFDPRLPLLPPLLTREAKEKRMHGIEVGKCTLSETKKKDSWPENYFSRLLLHSCYFRLRCRKSRTNNLQMCLRLPSRFVFPKTVMGTYQTWNCRLAL